MIRNELGNIWNDWEAPEWYKEQYPETYEELATQKQVDEKGSTWASTLDTIGKITNTTFDIVSSIWNKTPPPLVQPSYITIPTKTGIAGIDMKTIFLIGGLGLAGILVFKVITAQR